MSDSIDDLVKKTIADLNANLPDMGPPRKVTFNGEVMWFMGNEDGNGPLATLDMCDEDGNPTGWESYAYVDGGVIRRYHQRIGVAADLIPVDAPK